MSANLPPIPPSPSVPPPPPPPSAPAASFAGSRGGGGSDPDVGAWLSEAWNVVMANPVPLIVGFLIAAIASAVSLSILAGPFLVALTLVAKRCLDNQSPEIGEVFSGFEDFARTFLAGLPFMIVGLVFVAINFVLPFVGTVVGIVLEVVVNGLTFVYIPIVAFRREVQPLDALTQSIQFALANLQPIGVLAAVVTGLHVAGMLACCIGTLVTVPLALVFQVIAYERYYLPRS